MQPEAKQEKGSIGWGIPLSIGILVVIFIFIKVYNSSNDSGSTTNNSYARPEYNSSATNKVTEETPQKKSKVEVLSHSVKKVYGNTSIVGEIQNNGSSPASFVKVTATFYDSSGKVVDTSFTYAGDTANTPLGSGKKSPFEIGLIGGTPFSTYKLDVDWH